jgi:hypothetical protein
VVTPVAELSLTLETSLAANDHRLEAGAESGAHQLASALTRAQLEEQPADDFFVEALVPLDDVNDALLFGKAHLLLAAATPSVGTDTTPPVDTNAQVASPPLPRPTPL